MVWETPQTHGGERVGAHFREKPRELVAVCYCSITEVNDPCKPITLLKFRLHHGIDLLGACLSAPGLHVLMVG